MNDIEWVTGNWTDIKSGEPVRIQSEYGSIEGKAVHVDDDNTSVLVQYLLTNSTRVHRLAGMQVFVKAAPVVALPTEPGLYTTDTRDLTRSMPLYQLNENSEWSTIWAHMGEQKRAPAEILDGIEPKTLTRLEPVSETAKKVLDRVVEVWPWSTSTTMLNRVAVEFGVEL